MIPRALLSLLALILAACAQTTAPTSPALPPGVLPSIAYETVLTGPAQSVVEVEVTDPNDYYRVTRVVLEGPAGQSLRADEIIREIEVFRDASPRWSPFGSIGIGGGNVSGVGVGVGIGVPLGIGTSPRSRQSIVHSRARIPLPDPEEYARSAENWTLTIHLVGPTGQDSVASVPAPRPRTAP